MSKKPFLVIFLLLSGACFAQDERREPSRTYFLSMDDQNYMISIDNPVQLPGDFHNPTVTLNASPFRLFPYGGIEFKYPAWFTWEADLSHDTKKTWVLSGNDFKIMYFVFPQKTSVERYAQELEKAFGHENVQMRDFERELGGQNHKGKKLLIRISGVDLVYEVYGLSSNNGARLLVLQDKPAQNGAVSVEGMKALEMMSNSFKNTL